MEGKAEQLEWEELERVRREGLRKAIRLVYAVRASTMPRTSRRSVGDVLKLAEIARLYVEECIEVRELGGEKLIILKC